MLELPLIAPEPGDYRELDSGILWSRLPLPGMLTHINVWLLPTQRGWWLIDTGMATPQAISAWSELEQRLGLQRRLEGILITHHHPDHFGLAQHLAQRFAVPLHMSSGAWSAALAAFEGLTAALTEAARRLDEYFGAGMLECMRRARFGDLYRSVLSGLPAPPLALPEGPLALGDATWQVSHHHGHAPAHACLYDRHAGTLVSGDQVLPSISSNVSLYADRPDDDPWDDFLRSLEVLRALPRETLVLPAHGRPFHGLRARLETLGEEHAQRAQTIRALCAVPQRAPDIAEMLFRLARLDPFNQLLALGETLAHLRWLERRGLLLREERAGAVYWYSAADRELH